jgi:hypothetical protein
LPTDPRRIIATGIAGVVLKLWDLFHTLSLAAPILRSSSLEMVIGAPELNNDMTGTSIAPTVTS